MVTTKYSPFSELIPKFPDAYFVTVDRTRGHVKTVVTGCISVADILGHFDAARQEQALSYTELVDVRGVTAPFLSTSEIWRAASQVRNFKSIGPFGSRAIITGSDVVFGMVRMFSNLISDFFPIRVFREQEEAEEWLVGQPSECENEMEL